MNLYCSRCGKPATDVDFGVSVALCSVDGSDESITVTESSFSDWYCFECFPPTK